MATAQRSRARTTTDAAAPAKLSDNGMTHREVLTALSGLLLGMFVSMLASTVVGTSLPLIIADLDGDQTAFTWVVTATLLATTVSTPIWGKLADLFNRKLLLQLALVIFVVGIGDRGLRAGHRDAHHDARVPGPRRGRPRGAQPDRHGRHHQPARARQVRRPLRRASWPSPPIGGPLLGGVITDTLGLALELLRRPARSRSSRSCCCSARCTCRKRPKTQGDDRLPRHRAHLGRRLAAAHLGVARRQRVRVELDDESCSWSAAPSLLLAIAVIVELRVEGADHPARPLQEPHLHALGRSRRSRSASRCSAPRSSSASTCSSPAARPRPSRACSPSR